MQERHFVIVFVAFSNNVPSFATAHTGRNLLVVSNNYEVFLLDIVITYSRPGTEAANTIICRPGKLNFFLEAKRSQIQSLELGFADYR